MGLTIIRKLPRLAASLGLGLRLHDITIVATLAARALDNLLSSPLPRILARKLPNSGDLLPGLVLNGGGSLSGYSRFFAELLKRPQGTVSAL